MQLELSAKRERVEEEVKCSRQQKMERTMQMSAIAAINQNLARVRTGNNWWIQVGCGGLPPRWFELVGNPQVSLQRCCAGEAIWRNLNVRKTLRSQSCPHSWPIVRQIAALQISLSLFPLFGLSHKNPRSANVLRCCFLTVTLPYYAITSFITKLLTC